MNRAILVILTLVLFGSAALAGPKQKIAILGLEAVVGSDGQINAADTAFAKELTRELRSRANNSKDYEPTKDQRELSDEKLMNNCASENPQCMAPIGASMKADVVLFGKVSNLSGKGYKVTLTMISVSRQKQLQNDPNAVLTAAETKNPGLGNWVREHWRKVTGETSDGTIVVMVPGGVSGRVLVDGEVKETFKSGQATVVLPEGNRYRITVEADGYKTWEKDNVVVAGEKTVELKPELSKVDIKVTKDPNENVVKDPNEGVIERQGTVSKSSGKTRTVFKVAAIVGLGGAALAGAGWIYSWRQTKFDLDDGTTVTGGSKPNEISEGDCGKKVTFTRNGMPDTDAASAFGDACDGYKNTKWLAPTTIGLGVIGGAALVYLLVSKDNSEQQPANATGHRVKKRRNLIVTPVVSPDGTGATLRFDW
jgi:ribosomal protein S9